MAPSAFTGCQVVAELMTVDGAFVAASSPLLWNDAQASQRISTTFDMTNAPPEGYVVVFTTSDSNGAEFTASSAAFGWPPQDSSRHAAIRIARRAGRTWSTGCAGCPSPSARRWT